MKVKRFFLRTWGLITYVFDTIREYISIKYDGFRLYVAIKFADAYQRAYNKRYYVVCDANNRLQVINNDDIKNLKKRRKYKRWNPETKKYDTISICGMNPHATHLDVMRDCFYFTSLKANEDGNRLTMEERKNRKSKWLTYMEQVRRNNMKFYGKKDRKK